MLSKRENGNVPKGVADRARQRSRQGRGLAAIYSHQPNRQLASKNRGRKHIARNDQSKIDLRLQVRADTDVHVDGDPACADLQRASHVASGGYIVMPIDRAERPARLLRHRREASEEARQPKAHAAFVSGCNRRRAHESAESKNEMPKPRTRHAMPPPKMRR